MMPDYWPSHGFADVKPDEGTRLTKRVVVIGATGHFGGRICRRLLDQDGIELIVTSRSADSAIRLADLLAKSSSVAVSGAGLDQSSNTFLNDLAVLCPDIVIHTAGPYQGQEFGVAEACIECHSHYIDLADGREFVARFSELDKRARKQDLLLVSGASTLPGLSSAVIEHFRQKFQQIDAIQISIAPAHQTPRGPGTIAAVLSYCGVPFDVLTEGRWKTVHGWQDLKRQSYPDLGKRWSAACDVPDLSLLQDYVPGVKTITFHAALEASWEQFALWKMAWLTRMKLIRHWNRFVPFFHWASDNLIGLGTDQGGMSVALSGTGTSGNPLTVRWFLSARRNHGPEIPCSPALVLTRKLAEDNTSLRGAYPCTGLITLEEFDNEVRGLDIDWTFQEDEPL